MPSTSLSASDRLLLVSDLHLTEEAPELTGLALSWIEHQTQDLAATHLWILGDLFDAWVGDDQLAISPCAQQVACTLRAIAARGVSVGLMAGNRDFLLGQAFAQACAGELLPESWSGGLPNGVRALICHGDSLCLDDLDYMEFRSRTREATWQRSFAALPITERMAQARQMRSLSETHKAGKPMEIMDIRPTAAEQCLRNSACVLLVHGHTHRPGHSPLGGCLSRWVLTDWFWAERPADRRGGGLLLSASGVQVLGLSGC